MGITKQTSKQASKESLYKVWVISHHAGPVEVCHRLVFFQSTSLALLWVFRPRAPLRLNFHLASNCLFQIFDVFTIEN